MKALTDSQRGLAGVLMARAAEGGRDAFGKLAELAGETVYRFCLSQLGPRMRDAADDVRQECFLRAWRIRKRFRPGGDAVGWLLGIAMNVVREQRRKRRPLMSLDHIDPPHRPRPDADERLERLASVVEDLPARQREAVACRFLQGMSVAETARVMSCAEGTVKAMVHKAVANLQRMMNRREP